MSKSSSEILIYLSTELPFWVPIESGSYILANKHTLNLRNDFWLVSVGNIIDGPYDSPWEFVVNESQVLEEEYLNRITGDEAKYHHKEKMKTTFTRALEVKGAVLSAEVGTKAWQQQLEKVVFHHVSNERCDGFLIDINQFLDHYSTLISTVNPSKEVRRVNYYDIMLRVLVSVDLQGTRFLYSTQLAPDNRMIDFPFPRFRVRNVGESKIFGDTIQNLEEPVFHQIQWSKTLNHNRERRYQEALLSAAITLETLTHLFLNAKGFRTEKERDVEIQGNDRRGLAGWLRSLKSPYPIEECEDVAKLWLLRNDVVHNQRKLLENEIEIIKTGIKSIVEIRNFFLKEIDQDLLRLENGFSSFLEQVQLGTATGESVDGKVPIRMELRFEKDHYQTAFRPRTDSEEL